MTSYEQTLRQLATEDESIVVLTAENRAAIRGLPPLLGPRFVDVGICEQTMIGAAAGLALRGRKPICHALATFLTLRAFEFIRTDVGIGRLPVTLVGGVPGFLSDGNGPTHQAIEDIALMRGIPGMNVFCPSDEPELARALPVLLASGAPCYVRHNARPAVATPKPRASFALGQSEVVAEGTAVTILSVGFLLGEALKAREILAAAGVSARVVDVRTPVPFDVAPLEHAAKANHLVVTLEDHFLVGGLHSIVCEALVKKRLGARVLPIALEGKWFRPGLLPDVLRHEGFTGDAIAARIRAAL